MNAVNVCCVLGVVFTLSAFAWNTAPQEVKEGNKLFQEEQYEKALHHYHEAEVKNSKAPEIPFNMGNSFYRQEKYDEAIQANQRSIQLGLGPAAAKAYYNIGNAKYQKGDLEGSLEAYKKAVDLDTQDIDTKYNIELIQKMMQQNPQQNQQSSSQDQKENPQEDQEEQQSSSDQDQDQGQDEEEEQQSGQQDQEDSDASQKPEGGQDQEQQDISPEDAERLLGALQSEEKQLPDPREGKGSTQQPLPVEKDW